MLLLAHGSQLHHPDLSQVCRDNSVSVGMVTADSYNDIRSTSSVMIIGLYGKSYLNCTT